MVHLVQRCAEALQAINVAAFNELSVKGVGTKELAKSLASIKVEQVMFEGVAKNAEVCNMMEHVINKCEPRIIQEVSMMKSFVNQEAFSLFVGRKYLTAALTFKEKKSLDETDRDIMNQLKH